MNDGPFNATPVLRLAPRETSNCPRVTVNVAVLDRATASLRRTIEMLGRVNRAAAAISWKPAPTS